MKLIALLLTFCLTFNVLAASGTVSELERALDDYQYSLTVEWDQKDQAAHDKLTKEFFARINSLMNEKGLKKEEILALVDKKVSNKQTVDALKLKLTLMGKASSTEEMAKIIRESSKDMYTQGANWNGNASTVLIGAAVVAILGYAIWFSATHECVEWGEQWTCSDYEYCRYYDYDAYGFSYCASYYYETTCGWDTVCTRYERRD